MPSRPALPLHDMVTVLLYAYATGTFSSRSWQSPAKRASSNSSREGLSYACHGASQKRRVGQRSTTGIRPGEKVSDYERMTIRFPKDVRDDLATLSAAPAPSGGSSWTPFRPMWRGTNGRKSAGGFDGRMREIVVEIVRTFGHRSVTLHQSWAAYLAKRAVRPISRPLRLTTLILCPFDARLVTEF